MARTGRNFMESGELQFGALALVLSATRLGKSRRAVPARVVLSRSASDDEIFPARRLRLRRPDPQARRAPLHQPPQFGQLRWRAISFRNEIRSADTLTPKILKSWKTETLKL